MRGVGLKTKMVIGCCCLVALVILVGALGYNAVRSGAARFVRFEQLAQRIVAVGDLESAIGRQMLALERYNRAFDETTSAYYEKSAATVTALTQELEEELQGSEHHAQAKALIDGNRGLSELYAQLRTLNQEQAALLTQMNEASGTIQDSLELLNEHFRRSGKEAVAASGEQALVGFLRGRANTLTFSFSSDTSLLAKARDGLGLIVPLLDDISAHVSDNETKERFDAAFTAFSAFISQIDKLEQLTVQEDELVKLRMTKLADAALKVVGELKEGITKDGTLLAEQQLLAGRRALGQMGFTVIAAVLAGLVGAWIFASRITAAVRSISTRIGEAAAQVFSAANEIAQGGQKLAQAASEQAATLEEMNATLEIVFCASKDNAHSAAEANSFVTSTMESSERSTAIVHKMEESIGAVRNANKDTEAIIKSIDEIAFQTNLLALNAAVESARAGDAGKGFSVVAEEVRNLAQRSSVAARETTERIQKSSELSDRGVHTASEVTSTLKSIRSDTSRVSGLIASIAAANQKLAENLKHISISFAELDHVTQSNASSAEEFAASGEELSAQSRALTESVGALTRLVDGSDERRAAAPLISAH